LWGVDQELDSSLLEELLVSKPQHIRVGSGLAGDRGAMTLSLPNQRATLEVGFFLLHFQVIYLAIVICQAYAYGGHICIALQLM